MATDFLEALVANALFFGQPLSITQWTAHLFSVAPDELGFNGIEISAATGYQPVRCDPGADRWIKSAVQDPSGNTVIRNNVPILFPAAVVALPGIVAVGLKDQSGQLCFVGNLTTPKIIAAGDAPVFMAGELEFLIS